MTVFSKRTFFVTDQASCPGVIKHFIFCLFQGKYSIHRDGVLFCYVLNYLQNKKIVLPENLGAKLKTATHPSVDEDAGELAELDVGQAVTAEGEGAAVADHDGAGASRDAGLESI
jgi:hypothetical protein